MTAPLRAWKILANSSFSSKIACHALRLARGFWTSNALLQDPVKDSVFGNPGLESVIASPPTGRWEDMISTHALRKIFVPGHGRPQRQFSNHLPGSRDIQVTTGIRALAQFPQPEETTGKQSFVLTPNPGCRIVCPTRLSIRRKWTHPVGFERNEHSLHGSLLCLVFS